MEEDIGFIINGKLEAGFFASPTNWIPASKAGLDLMSVHAPVADNERLIRAMSGLSKAICGDYMYRRWVWTIAPTNDRSMHPKYKSKWKPPETIDDLFLRVETQTTVPLVKDSAALFLVKVDIIPLLEVFDTHRDLVVNSINSMSENVLTYKNLHQIKNIINRC